MHACMRRELWEQHLEALSRVFLSSRPDGSIVGLQPRFRVDVSITARSHSSEAAINKQLADKERVAAAMENPNLASMVAKVFLREG